MKADRGTVLLVVLALGVGACSTAPVATTGGTPVAPSIAPTVMPSPTGLSKSEMAAAYTACAKPYATATAALNKQINKATTLKALKKAMRGFADSETSVESCFRAVAWTPEFQSDVRTLLKALSAIQVTELAMSRAPDLRTFDRLYKTWQTQGLAVASAGNQLRLDLGMPPVG